MSKRVLIFGGNGGIGKWAVEYALEAGYEVSVYLRNASKMENKDSRLNVFEGELVDRESVAQALRGQDVVVWCVGITMKYSYPTMYSLEGHKVLLEEMKKAGVKRLIDWATPSVRFWRDKKSLLTLLPSFLASIFLKQAKKEMLEIASLVENSDLDWTLVRFVAPRNTPIGSEIKVSFGEKRINFLISRADIAHFMIEQIQSREYIKSMPIIGR